MDYNQPMQPEILNHSGGDQVSHRSHGRISNLKQHIDQKLREFQQNEQAMREAYKKVLSGRKSSQNILNGHPSSVSTFQMNHSENSLPGSPTKLINQKCENHYIQKRTKSAQATSNAGMGARFNAQDLKLKLNLIGNHSK